MFMHELQAVLHTAYSQTVAPHALGMPSLGSSPITLQATEDLHFGWFHNKSAGPRRTHIQGDCY